MFKFSKNLILIICSILIAGAIGSFLFQLFVFPYILQNSYFAQFQFIKNFKEGKIVINIKEQIFIQENVALQNSIEKVEKAVVGIQTKINGQVIFGSGLIITSDGLIITLADLVPAGGSMNVVINKEKVKPEVLKRDGKLALLKISNSDLKTCGFCESDKVKLGERVFLLGIASSDYSEIANEGIVRSFSEEAIKTNIFEASFLKGSPLFNIEGDFVGLSAIDSSGRIIAIPAQKIRDFVGF